MSKKIDYAKLYTLRSDGRYQATYTDDKGERHYKYSRDPEKLYWIMQALNQPTEPTFKEIAEAWHASAWLALSDGTKGSYASAYKRALDEMKGMMALDISSADITRHLEKLKAQGLGSKTVKTQRTVYSQVFQSAINSDDYCKFIKINPARTANLPKGLTSAQREAPEDEIIKKIRSNATSAYWGLFAMFLISTGCRRGEALAITWADIDFETNMISINNAVKFSGGHTTLGDPKTKSGVRVVPLLPDLKKLLKKPKTAKNADYVFCAENGSYIGQSTYNRRWKHYCKDQGFIVCVKEEKRKSKQGHKYIYRQYKNTLTAHTLRHGYATMLFEAGVDVYTAQKLLGHADIRTTMAIYTHLRDKQQQSSLQKLTDYVRENYAV